MQKFTLLVLATVLAACEEVSQEDICDRINEQEHSNGLPMNGLFHNGLSMNGLFHNGLPMNGLSINGKKMNGLSSNGKKMNGLDVGNTTAGTMYHNVSLREFARKRVNSRWGRELLTYMASCALEDGDALQVGDYVFPGSLGILPHWKSQPLSDIDEERISACLMAHVNAYGASVQISLRLDGVVPADAIEQAAFPVYEGAFFGSLANDQRYTCQGLPREEALEMSSLRALRVCTDGEDACHFINVGLCEEVCDTHVAGYGWTDCKADGTLYTQVINTFLIDDLDTDCLSYH